MTIQKIKSGRVNGVDADGFIGDLGQIFYNEELGDLRLSDGVTPGGTPLSNGGGGSGYILPRSTATRLGGIKIGANISIDVNGIASVAAPFSKNYNELSNRPDLTVYQLSADAFNGNYNQLSNLPTLFSGNYNDLSNTPTIPTDINQLTDNDELLEAGNASITVSDVPPTSPTVGQLWWDTVSGDLYIYFDSNWVPAVVTVVGPKGDAGAAGLSAYQLAVNNGFVGTITDWLVSLNGVKGDLGADGLSAYEVAVQNGFVGTEAAWLTSLIGPPGTSASIAVNSTAPSNPSQGALWYDTERARLYIYYVSSWIDASPATGGTVDLSAVTQNIVPAQDNTYDLGSPQKTWRHLYVGAGTLYVGGAPISNVDGNIKIDAPLTVGGTDGITFSDGTRQYSAVPGSFTIPKATDTQAGVVKIGENVNITIDGTISVPKGAGINTVKDIPDVNSTAGGAVLNDGALLIYNASSERWDTVKNLRSNEMDGGFF